MMPINRFWILEKNADRIKAEEDLRALNIAGASQSAENFRKVSDQLTRIIGATVVREEKLDRGGLEMLRSMSKPK